MTIHLKSKEKGFTIVELIIVITIVLILAALVFGVAGQMRKRASSAQSMSNLKQISEAFNLFAADNDGYLPGPSYCGQPARFSVPPDENDTRLLGWNLRDYLPVEKIADDRLYNQIFSYPMWRSKTGEAGPSYYVNRRLVIDGRSYWPVGRVQSENSISTMSMAQLASFDLTNTGDLTLYDLVFIYEVDQEAPIGTPGWLSDLPEKPLHGDYRNALLFDWSVQQVPLEEFEGAPNRG